VGGTFIFSGISLRRVNPNYVVQTEICVNLTGLDLKIFDDKYFNAFVKLKKKKLNSEKEFMMYIHKNRQMKIDKYLKKKLNQIFFLKYYLKARSKIF